ncbi:helix-turn-helix transcriptional regulator [Streptomyces sp. SKN60]|uniref:helix-turn-helix domain-containing protein n=1 Tax=Streptomyces sp. SKN60 TaxID=2855506 RepID=UPI002245DD83|nr:helix-turn-helix transcriptional regulator [Streptomyces sp. SKN60]
MRANERKGTEVQGPTWDLDPGDESGAAIVAMVGRQIRRWREAKRLRAVELGRLIGYGEDIVRKIERGDRIPRPEFLDKADEALGANGIIAAMKQDILDVRYPSGPRSLAKLEARAAEFCAYQTYCLHGLLQTEDYARAIMRTHRPVYRPEVLERYVAHRVGRQSVFTRAPAPEFSFVLEEVTLRRPIGGPEAMRRQLEHLVEVGDMPNVEIQVMPTAYAGHPGLTGALYLLKFPDGTAAGDADDFRGRPTTDPKRIRLLELRYGIIRAHALTPEDSRDLIEQVLKET